MPLARLVPVAPRLSVWPLPLLSGVVLVVIDSKFHSAFSTAPLVHTMVVPLLMDAVLRENSV